MLRGDISNQLSPAVAIHVDLLGSIEKKYLGLKTSFKPFPYTRDILSNWFNKDLAIYVICTGTFSTRGDEVEKVFDDLFIPYTRIYEMDDTEAWLLNEVLNASHIVGFYYSDHNLINFKTHMAKRIQVPHLSEVNYSLNGG